MELDRKLGARTKVGIDSSRGRAKSSGNHKDLVSGFPQSSGVTNLLASSPSCFAVAWRHKAAQRSRNLPTARRSNWLLKAERELSTSLLHGFPLRASWRRSRPCPQRVHGVIQERERERERELGTAKAEIATRILHQRWRDSRVQIDVCRGRSNIGEIIRLTTNAVLVPLAGSSRVEGVSCRKRALALRACSLESRILSRENFPTLETNLINQPWLLFQSLCVDTFNLIEAFDQIFLIPWKLFQA